MKVNKNQLELVELEDDRAYFFINDTELSFECAFGYETEVLRAELDYFNGTGQLECTEVSFIDVIYISHLYDEDHNSQGAADVNKTDLEDIIKAELENQLND